ncbi:MAG: 16S rRNA (cytosine(967)-C(5))-methyltransferase RsmB [Pseudomonadota bacterium]
MAHQTLIDVVSGRSVEATLNPRIDPLARREASLCQELVYGTLRWLPRLDAIADRLLSRPIKSKDRPVRLALLLGLYQLLYTRVPAHAAISTAVDLLARGRWQWGKGVVNGCLRNFERRKDDVLRHVERLEAARLAHPPWLLESLRRDWPQHWESTAQANNAHAPMTIRINLSHGPREDYVARLDAVGITGQPTVHSSAGFTLERPMPAEQLPGFSDGAVSVQDEASQLAATLLNPKSGHRVLDACAAPGGKTAHLLESVPGLALVALDNDATRLGTLRENLDRLGLSASTHPGNAAHPSEWWDGQPFDRILLDAPCSATGVIRRHPDIKLHRRAGDIARLGDAQTVLLDTLWPLLAEGGWLLYATCSLLHAENTEQIVRFLARQPDAELLPIDANWGRKTEAGRQILPGDQGMDGFFYARLAKR